MYSYIISYDLNSPGRNYTALYAAIKKLAKGWCHCLDSTWIVGSDLSAKDIVNRLGKVLDANDALFVSKLGPGAAWRGLSTERSEWLKKNLPSGSLRASLYGAYQ